MLGLAPALLCFLVLGLPGGAFALTPLVLSPDRPQIDAWESLALKADPTYQRTAQDMAGRLNEFEKAAPGRNSLGVQKAALWLRVPIVAPSALRHPWVVSIDYSSLQAEMYLISNGRVLQQVRRSAADGELPFSRTPTMAFSLQAGQPYDLLIRVEASGPLILPVTISEMPTHTHVALREQMLQGLLNGLAVWLLAYSLIQWALQRDPMFGFYALVVLGSAGFSLHFFGVGAQFLWPGNPWMERHAAIAAGLTALVGSFLFLGQALAGGARQSQYATLMRTGAAVTAVVGTAFVLGWLSVPLAIIFMSLVGPLPSLMSVPVAIQRVRQKDPIGATLLVAWAVYGAGAVAMVCLVQGWVPANFWTLHAFQFSATLDMLLFLHVLGLRAQATRLAAQQALRERDLMQSLAHSDPLTGLENRRGLQRALGEALARCNRRKLVAVYLLDLDGFKPVNDTYGHDVGDDLLVAVGKRLQASVRHSTDVVARLGGDEFIIMACALESEADADELGRALLRSFDQPFTVNGLSLTLGLTIGYALAPLDGMDPQGLIRRADAAMYAGKQTGKHSVRRNAGDLALPSGAY